MVKRTFVAGVVAVAALHGVGAPRRAWGQTLPDDEVQVDVSGYFDSFRVNVIYPTISVTKSVGPTTSISGRYLIDAITAASIRSSSQQVDAVTSASGGGFYEGFSFDEIRQEFSAGVTQLLYGMTLSMNGIFGTESDYSSATTTAHLSIPFARNNTILQAGFVRSWDRNFPKTQPWTKTLDVTTWQGGLTQVLSKRFIVQIDASLALNRGFQSEPYTVVPVEGPSRISIYDPVHPYGRDRRAIGIRANYMLKSGSALKLGYRYYWDDWDVKSHTVDLRLDQRFDSGVMIGTGIRLYSQSRAFFFEPVYTQPQDFMTVDSKLDRTFSAEFEVEAVWDGTKVKTMPVLGTFFSDQSDLTLRFDLYVRHTASPNWFSGSQTLLAGIVGVGYRYRF